MRRTMLDAGAEMLREAFALRSARRVYSLRAFARDLGVSHTYLSLILNGKKRLPLNTLVSLSTKLGLDHRGLSQLGHKIDVDQKRSRAFARLEIDRFRLLSQWYYVAILELIEIDTFKFSAANVAEYFHLSIDETKEALTVLKRLGLIRLTKGKWTKVENRFSVVAPNSQAAIRAYHRQMILKAYDELSKTSEPEFKLRDITGITMPINPHRILGAKRKLARFRRSLEAYLTQGKCSEVYQLNLQLFPLRGAGKKREKPLEELC
jgi:transcriptional regulator with XRE-family HTH domain